MTRTYEEMVGSALQVRKAMLDKGQDPTTGKFFCTDVEKRMILDRPSFMEPCLSIERDRICGLKIEIISSAPIAREHR